MTREMDTITIESRREIEELMEMVSKYIEQNPKEKNNKTLQRFWDILDVMHMEW